MIRRLMLLAAVAVSVYTSAGSAQAPPQAQPLGPAGLDRSRAYVRGELLVGFRDGAGPPDIAAVYQRHALEERENLDAGRLQRALRRVAFPIADGQNVAEQTERAIAILMRNPLVRFAEPNYVFRTSQLPNDPRFGDLYGLHNIGQTSGASDADIDAPEAWNRTTGSANTIVFVIDTGVDYSHPDLAANLWTNAAEASGQPNVDDDGNGYVDDVHGMNAIAGSGDPMDDHGHGTHVAGTIGATGNNGTGVVGVAWSVRIGACKFLESSGTGTLADAVQCFHYVNKLKAAGHNIVVTNNSWGDGGFSQALMDAMAGVDQPAIQPILHVCAAGNNGSNVDVFTSYPSGYDLANIVAVAATDHNDLYASFTNYGATSVDLAAPGVAILSTVPLAGSSCCSDPTGYKRLSGTSMATPFVAGAAALVWSANPGLPASAVKTRLLGGSDYIGGLGSNAALPTLTQGRLNAYGALEVGDDLVPPAPVALSVTAKGLNSMTLAWIASGDDGTDGSASSYDLRYSTGLITGANWSAATRASGEPVPQASGSQEACIVTGLQPGTVYYFALKVRDNGANESALSNIAADTTQTGITLFEDDMTVAGAWATAGSPGQSLWHRTQHRSNSPSHAWWYGREDTGTYNTGAANWGTLTTSLDLSGYAEAGLSFAEWSHVELTATFDRTRVQASLDGTEWITVFESHGTNGAWAERWVDLTAYAGQIVHVRFHFDTFDPVLNDYEGWYVDDVRVVGLPLANDFAAAFAGSPTAGFAPLTVQFTDQSLSSSAAITNWDWDFGAGPGSNAQNPAPYMYLEPGSYTVMLTVRNAAGVQASLTKTGYVTVKRTVKVDSISYSTANRGKDLVVAMRIANWAGNAIAGATVKANIYRGTALAKSFTATSNLDGTLTYKLKNASGCYNTVVTLISSTNHEWNGLTPSNNSCN